MIQHSTIQFVTTLYSFKSYRLVPGLFILYSPTSYWLMESKLWGVFKVVRPLCLRSIALSGYVVSYYTNLFSNFSVYSTIFSVKWFRFVLFSGLGYKRRFFPQKRIMFTYIGDRHWILYKFNQFSTVIPTKKRNFIFFSTSKNTFAVDYGFFSSLRKPYVYKMKGFLDRRVRRRFLFVRRIRLRGLKMKLSKKQLML